MKKLIIIILGSCLLNPIYSQIYHPIPNDSVWWVEQLSYPYMGGSCIEFRYSYIYPNGLVNISGENYIELRSNHVVEYQYFGPPPSPCPSSGYSLSDQFYAFIRNDSINRKIYLYDTVNLHADVLLYDFNLNVGDTVQSINGYEINNCPNDTFIVQAIDSVDIEGEYRKRFEVTTNGGGWSPIYIIESIGSNLGLAYPYYCPFEANSFFICYHHNQLEYGNTSSSYCIQTLAVPTIANEPKPIISNLGNHMYEIKIAGAGNIQCLDALGRSMFSSAFQQSTILNLHELKAGIYYLVINGQQINSQVFKIVISH